MSFESECTRIRFQPASLSREALVLERTKLTIPVMAVGGEKSFGPTQAVIMRHVATNVQDEVVAGSGHWLEWLMNLVPPRVARLRRASQGLSFASTVLSLDGVVASFRLPENGSNRRTGAPILEAVWATDKD